MNANRISFSVDLSRNTFSTKTHGATVFIEGELDILLSNLRYGEVLITNNERRFYYYFCRK